MQRSSAHLWCMETNILGSLGEAAVDCETSAVRYSTGELDQFLVGEEDPSGDKILTKTNSYFLGTWASFWTSPLPQGWPTVEVSTVHNAFNIQMAESAFIDYFQAESFRCLLILLMARYLHGFYSLVCLRQYCDGNAHKRRKIKPTR